MFNDSYDPLKLMTSSLAVWADTARALQKQTIATATHLAEQSPVHMALKSGTPDVPIERSENYFRATFQTMASINLNAWTHTANVLAAMPSWTRWPSQMPGCAMSEIFNRQHDTDSEKSSR